MSSYVSFQASVAKAPIRSGALNTTVCLSKSQPIIARSTFLGQTTCRDTRACFKRHNKPVTRNVRGVSAVISQPTPYVGEKILKLPQSIDQWIQDNQDQTEVVKLFKEKIAGRPTSTWLGDWNTDVKSAAKGVADQAKAQDALYVVVCYNIPGRDAGNYSAGGAPSAEAYRKWIDDVAAGLQGTKGIVILEPDALGLLDLVQEDWRKNERLSLLQYAIATLSRSGANVYIDATHARWLDVNTASSRLQQAGVGAAAGFALNVSNHVWTTENIDYGNKVCEMIGGNKGFIVDTSRNGAGPPEGATGEDLWCNVPSARLGEDPTLDPGRGEKVHALLWIKPPGESDGTCQGGPSAGQFWAEGAKRLAGYYDGP